MKRIFDIVISLILVVAFCAPMLLTAIFLFLVNKGSVFYWSKRVGKNNQIFLMPKFRTMRLDTPQVASHLLKNAQTYYVFGGAFIRKLSIDELPQLYSVILGEMSIVGPRPALFNQDDLVQLRTQRGIHRQKPGITGWAQINGRDEISNEKKVELEDYYLKNESLILDLKICLLTLLKVVWMKDISH